MRKQANALLKTLSDYAEGKELRLDRDGAAYCIVAGALTVFSYAEETGELIASACLAPLPEEGTKARVDAVRELMLGNYAWGGTSGGILGLDDETGRVFLSRRFDVASESPAAFLEKMARLSGMITHWNTVLTQGKTPPSASMGIRA